MKSKQIPIIIRDTGGIKNVIIQLDLKQNKTTVLSNYSSWENLAFIMEALALTAQKCISDGMDKKHVHKTIYAYLEEVLESYHI